MRLPIFLVLLTAALAGTAAALRLATQVASRQGVMYATGLSAGTAVVWLLTSIASFNVVSVSGGETITNSYPGLGALAVLGVGVSVLILGKGSLELIA